MPLDPNIALSYKPVEIPNALAQYGQAMQVQAAQRQNEVSQMQLEQMRRDEDTLKQIQAKAVAHGGPADLNEIADAYLKSGNPKFVEFGIGLRQKLDERNQFAQIMGGMSKPAQPGALGSGTFGITPQPANAMAPANALTNVDELRAKRNALLAIGSQQAIAAANALTKDIELASNVKTAAPGHAILSPSGQVIGNVPEGKTELQRNFEYAKNQGFKGSIFDYEREIKAAGRNLVQPVAPTITQIVDPVDPTKMITIDARRYQGGGAGSPGVLGVAGKEPAAALRQNKIEEGKSQLQDELDTLRASFDKLNAMAALPSTERGTLSNIASAAQSSGVGQMLGRAAGTEAQVERDVINSAKQRLITSIKNATGMSAQQLNSNMELQAMLRSLSDPSLGYEASKRIIDDIETAYVRGAGMKKAPPAGAGAAPKGIDPAIWNAMTPQERSLWQK